MVKNQAMADALERFGEWRLWLQDVLIGMGVCVGLDTLAFILEKGWWLGLGLPSADRARVGTVGCGWVLSDTDICLKGENMVLEVGKILVLACT